MPLTVVLALVLAIALNAAIRFRTFFRARYYVPYVTASVAVVGVWLFLFSGDGLVNQMLGPLAPDPSWLVNEHLGDADDRDLRDLEAARASSSCSTSPRCRTSRKELYESASVDGAGAWRFFRRSPCPGSGRRPRWSCILATITGANLFTEPYLLTGGGGPDGASTSPVLLMYQRGIEQGNPDIAAAIGVILVIGVLVDRLGQRRVPGEGLSHGATSRSPQARARAGAGRSGPHLAARAGASRSRRHAHCACSPLGGALLFLFPFYYMVIGVAAGRARHDLAGALPDPANLTLDNYRRSSTRVNLGRSLLNSGIFTGGVIAVHGRVRPARRLRPGATAVPRAQRRLRTRCCWCRSCRSSC